MPLLPSCHFKTFLSFCCSAPTSPQEKGFLPSIEVVKEEMQEDPFSWRKSEYYRSMTSLVLERSIKQPDTWVSAENGCFSLGSVCDFSLPCYLVHSVRWWDGMWCGVVWCGVVWCGVVWCGVWCGVWCSVMWCVCVCVCVCVWYIVWKRSIWSLAYLFLSSRSLVITTTRTSSGGCRLGRHGETASVTWTEKSLRVGAWESHAHHFRRSTFQ